MRVLELGFGSSDRSAVVTGGELFADPEVAYFGMSLPDEWQGVKEEHFDQVKPVDGHWAAIPYRDNTFGFVLMRSCFGQFTHSHNDAASMAWAVPHGMHEVARVLEPGGTLFITEENTPQDLDKVIPAVVEAGLDVSVFEREVDKERRAPNPAHGALRAKYYGDETAGIAGNGVSRSLFNPRYAFEAVRPTDRIFKRDGIGDRRLLARRTKAKGDLICVENEDQPLNYLVPEDANTLELELRVAETMVAVAGEYYNYWVDSVRGRMAKKDQPSRRHS